MDAANLDKAFLNQSHLGALSSLASLGGLGNLGNLGNLANLNNTSSSSQQATMQALHNQLIRGIYLYNFYVDLLKMSIIKFYLVILLKFCLYLKKYLKYVKIKFVKYAINTKNSNQSIN